MSGPFAALGGPRWWRTKASLLAGPRHREIFETHQQQASDRGGGAHELQVANPNPSYQVYYKSSLTHAPQPTAFGDIAPRGVNGGRNWWPLRCNMLAIRPVTTINIPVLVCITLECY